MSDRKHSWDSMVALSERILAANSATDELARWCCERGIGDGRIQALHARYAIPEALDDQSLEALYPHNDRGRTSFRRVRLTTAGIVVVETLDWYFSDHLTPGMREALESTNMPFERVIKPLKSKRRTFLIQRCTPEQLAEGNPVATAFEHRAVIYREDDVPLALVHERFRIRLVCNIPPHGGILRAAAPVRARAAADFQDGSPACLPRADEATTRHAPALRGISVW
jgi:hypothetical protein